MSLKAKLKPYIFAFGLILGLVFFSSNVLAYPSSGGIAITPTYFSEYGVWQISPTLYINIPANVFSTSDCSYNYPYSGEIGYIAQIYTSADVSTNISLGSESWTYSTIQNQGYASFHFNLTNTYDYPATGDYYVYLQPTDNSGACTPPDFYAYFPFHVDKENNLMTSVGLDVDGACGTADNVLPVTVPIPDNDACSSGTVDNMREIYTFDGVVFAWECLGSGEGITVGCESLPFPDPIDGACGTADGQSSFNEPDEEDKCSAGATNATTTITLTGWAWTCSGLYGGTDDACSSTYSGGGTPPEDIEVAPIPTPTDCSSYSGIDEIVCNIGNTIQGLFLPSSSKLIELQNTINDIGNVFPFNYLRAISTVFTNLNFSSGSLTMTMFGNTETLGDDFWNMEIFENIKLGVTILILLMFTFWALGYIKHFFK